MHGRDPVARLLDVKLFYDLLDRIEAMVGGKRTLATAHGRMAWPERGVYFFFEPGEHRTTSGDGMRVVRVGTHALNHRGKSTLWSRLRRHRGTTRGPHPGRGNHRKSVFRRHVGEALMTRDYWPPGAMDAWGSSYSPSKRLREYPLEQAVSQHIRSMPFLSIALNDPPGPESRRGYIERNAIALLSNHSCRATAIDPPSPDWLGQHAVSEAVQRSGLWNSNHVREGHDHGFLDVLKEYTV